MTERFLGSDPPAPDELDACARPCARCSRSACPTSARAARRVGVAGTVTTLAALDLGLVDYDPERVHGHRVSPGGVDAELERLAALTLEERRAVPGLEPERAPVIVAGIVVVREVLAFFGLAELEASERDILHGAALEAAELPERRGATRAAGRLHLLLGSLATLDGPWPASRGARARATPLTSLAWCSRQELATSRLDHVSSSGSAAASSARRRCDDAAREDADETAVRRPPARARGRAPRASRNASSSGVSASSVKSGSSAISRSGRRARIAAGGDDLAHERLARDHADEPAVVADEHGADLRPRERSPASCALAPPRARAARSPSRRATRCSRVDPARLERRRRPRGSPATSAALRRLISCSRESSQTRSNASRELLGELRAGSRRGPRRAARGPAPTRSTRR